MTVGIVGLGLIGGSLAKAICRYTDHVLIGTDQNDDVMAEALKTGILKGSLNAETVQKCEVILVSLYPDAVVDWIGANGSNIAKNCIVTDTCGIKGAVCKRAERIAEHFGFHFVGGHPMAGKEKTGWKAADEQLFQNASMILTPSAAEKTESVQVLTALFRSIGFGQVVTTTPEEHDKIIAFTSQLPHILSSAYVRSSTASRHNGFSAGSYRDLSRVATLNEYLWTELFLQNKAALLSELDSFSERLSGYIRALREEDEEGLRTLLKAGRERKEKLDGKVLTV